MVGARKALESLYTGVCCIYEYIEKLDSASKKTTHEIKPVYEMLPCRLSFKGLKNGVQGEVTDELNIRVKLFISPDVKVKPGSRITVLQDGQTLEFKSSGMGATYKSHQEILLSPNCDKA